MKIAAPNFGRPQWPAYLRTIYSPRRNRPPFPPLFISIFTAFGRIRLEGPAQRSDRYTGSVTPVATPLSSSFGVATKARLSSAYKARGLPAPRLGRHADMLAICRPSVTHGSAWADRRLEGVSRESVPYRGTGAIYEALLSRRLGPGLRPLYPLFASERLGFERGWMGS